VWWTRRREIDKKLELLEDTVREQKKQIALQISVNEIQIESNSQLFQMIQLNSKALEGVLTNPKNDE